MKIMITPREIMEAATFALVPQDSRGYQAPQRVAFISDACEAAQLAGIKISLDQFKAHVESYARYGQLNLQRCDLVGAYAQETVEASEVCRKGTSASHHFIEVTLAPGVDAYDTDGSFVGI